MDTASADQVGGGSLSALSMFEVETVVGPAYEVVLCSSFPDQVVDLFHRLQHSAGQEREAHLKALSTALRSPSAQLTFIK